MVFDIGAIYIFVRKREADGQQFANPARQWDGFVLFTAGEALYEDEASRAQLQPGDLIPLRRGGRYRLTYLRGVQYVTCAFDFTQTCPEIDALRGVLHLSCEQQRAVMECEALFRQRAPERYMRCKARLFELYAQWIGASRTPHEPCEPCARAEAFLRENYARAFTAQEIAQACGVSPSHLRALFHARTGLSILEYRDRLRAERAAEMLRSGLFTVTETALALGYCDVYYFSRAFKKRFGVPPSRLRGQ